MVSRRLLRVAAPGRVPVEVCPMLDDASNGWTAWKVAAIAYGMSALGACAYSFMLDGALASELAAARNDVRLAHNEIANLNAQLSLMEEQAQAQQQQLQGEQ